MTGAVLRQSDFVEKLRTTEEILLARDSVQARSHGRKNPGPDSFHALAENRTETSLEIPGSCMVTP
jgi:hypothetical protein